MMSKLFYVFYISFFSFLYSSTFIDGLHHFDQVIRDLLNVRKYLKPRGLVVLHDCLPQSSLNAERERSVKHWNGDVWKASYWLFQRNCPFDLYDFDEGLCVINNIESFHSLSEPTAKELDCLHSLTYDDFLTFRDKLSLLTEKDV